MRRSKVHAKLRPAARSCPEPAADAAQHSPAELLPVELQKVVPEWVLVELVRALAQHPDAPESAAAAPAWAAVEAVAGLLAAEPQPLALP